MPLVGEVPPPPPAKRSTRTSASTRLADQKPEQPSKAAERAKNLMDIAGVAQGVALMTGNYADAETIDIHAGPFLTAVAKLGDVHPQFGESLDKAQGIGPYFAVFAAAIPMAIQFMANHNRLDASRLRFAGVQDPAVLANRQHAKVMHAQAEMIREQRIAQEQAMQAQQTLQAEAEAFQFLNESMTPQNV